MDESRKQEIIELLARTVAGGAFATAVVAFPPAAALAGFVLPTAEYLTELGTRRVTATAVHASGLTERELLQRLAASEDGLRLLAVTMEAARTAIHEEKVRALGLALASCG